MHTQRHSRNSNSVICEHREVQIDIHTVPSSNTLITHRINMSTHSSKTSQNNNISNDENNKDYRNNYNICLLKDINNNEKNHNIYDTTSTHSGHHLSPRRPLEIPCLPKPRAQCWDPGNNSRRVLRCCSFAWWLVVLFVCLVVCLVICLLGCLLFCCARVVDCYCPCLFLR